MQTLNELKVGRFLGRYELLMPVAQGGMASVWAARLVGTRGFQKVVAIKTILPTLSEDARFEQMFLDEAALASRIRHPNVVQVLDLGEEGGLLYQVMEWIEGEPLSSFLRELPEGRCMPYEIAAKIMIGVCDGLHAAHETKDDSGKAVGLVHRDMSPQNILVTSDGVPKVVDFGVAKASSLSSVQTTTGTLKGKPAYMSPEQIQGGDIDRRADVFSIGVLLYILTTGRHPFRGANDMATLHNVVSSTPAVPVSKHRDDYPPALERVVMMALDKAPDKRFVSAAAVARALEAAVPEVHKVGDAEVAAFMRKLLAAKLDRRAKALRESLNEADLRASTPSMVSQLTGNPSMMQGLGGPTPTPGPVPPLMAAMSGLGAQEAGTPPIDGTTASVRPPKSGGAVYAVLALVALLVVAAAAAGVFLLVLRPRMQAAAREQVAPTTEVVPPPASAPQGGGGSGGMTATTESEAASAAISAESLPAAPKETGVAPRPAPWPRGRRPAEPATPPPASTPAPPPGATTDTRKGPGVRGTVPTIQDPGF